MLILINNLKPFFEDCYRRINVREYAKLIKVSPPTASKLLEEYKKEGFLKKEVFRNYIMYYVNTNNSQFVDFSKIYWRERFGDVISYIRQHSANSTIVLFGSLAKAEVQPNSDIDLAIFSHKKELDLRKFEKKLGRKIQVFWFKSLRNIRSIELANNVANGYVLSGRLEL